MEHTLSWRFDALSWYFAIITLGAAFLSSWFAAGEWGERFRSQGGNLWLFHVAMALNVLTMLVLLASGDLALPVYRLGAGELGRFPVDGDGRWCGH